MHLSTPWEIEIGLVLLDVPVSSGSGRPIIFFGLPLLFTGY